MKLRDLDADTLYDLERHYRYHPRRRPEHPANGDLWFDEGNRCAVCGYNATVEDHCHVTGFVRARLCHRCNSAEWSTDSELWRLYRISAPLLHQRRQYGHEAHRRQPIMLSADELATLPMGELLGLDRGRR